ncbi:MAG: outer membrane protein assembly factor BamC [Methylococcales bacterium]|jgi:outer membrane protein assembly factor BamC|nr:outer membrane protein assembly factor BamC [Methylococcales bacterium]MBT7443101.1 outer membrane protein assembly factor BamC [Methylococcales bacterium]
MIRQQKLIISVMLSSLLVGCSMFDDVKEILPDKKADYKKSRVGKGLEVPPDLTSSTVQNSLAIPDSVAGAGSYSQYRPNTNPNPNPTVVAQSSTGSVNYNSGILPKQENIRVQRDGDKRWLVVDAEPEQVWAKLREFWLESGFLLKMEDPRIGIMETDWAENRADIQDDFVRNFLKKALDTLYSAATRDKFRVRLEKGAQIGTTELFLSHKGMEEVVSSTGSSTDTTIWQPRASDPELEAEMLNRVMVFFGVEDNKAEQQLAKKQQKKARAQLIKGSQGDTSIVMDDKFSRAWRLTGLALDRVGFAVEDRDRSRGLFYVRYSDPYITGKEEEGFLDKLAFWSSNEVEDKNQYIVYLRGGAVNTRVVVLDKDGQPIKNETATRILTLLHEQLQK